ncbi:hypothetical protein CPR19088_GLDEOEPO_02451 [Companilactobacillus paralimentarius]
MGTDSSQKAVSNLDFEPRTIREVQNSSRGVSTKVLPPPSQRPKFLFLPASLFVIFFRIVKVTRLIDYLIILESS